MERSQKEYYLNEQMKAIQKELGDGDDDAEISEYMKKSKRPACLRRLRKRRWPKSKAQKYERHVFGSDGCAQLSGLDAGHSVEKRSKVNKDLNKAMEVLEQDHYGLDKVKERILEYLAVQARADKVKGPILCLVGPPGVGKTSLGKSIARATGRAFVRASLGGMRDEAEIRGHRRTYIGSMPGKIIKGMKRPGLPIRCFCLTK